MDFNKKNAKNDSKYFEVVKNCNRNLEDIEDLKTDWKSIRISNIVAFLGSVTMCSILPTVWPYMKKIEVNSSETVYGFINGVYALGNIVFSLLSGWLCNKASDTRPAMIIGKFGLIAAAMVYLFAEIFKSSYINVFIVFELLLGSSVGICNVYRTHIAMASREADRSKAFGMNNFASSLGLIGGPLLQAAFAQIHYPGIPLLLGIHLNLYTAPILLAAITSVIGIYLLFWHFDGRMKIRDIPAPIYSENVTLGTFDEVPSLEATNNNNNNNLKTENEEKTCLLPKYDTIAVIVLILVKLTTELVILNLAIVCPPYNMVAFEWTSEDSILFSTIIMFSIGALSIGFALIYIFFNMGQRLRERTALSVALFMFLGFYVLTYPWEFWSERISYQHIQGSLPQLNQTIASDHIYRAAMDEAQKLDPRIEIVGCNPSFEWCEKTPKVNVWVFNIVQIISLGIGFPLIEINLDILYSKILGPIKQGTLQGIFVATGQILNVVGPVIMSQIYTWYGPKIIWGFEIAVCAISIMVFFIFWKRLVPWSERNLINS